MTVHGVAGTDHVNFSVGKEVENSICKRGDGGECNCGDRRSIPMGLAGQWARTDAEAVYNVE